MGEIPHKSSHEDRLIKLALGGRVACTASNGLEGRDIGLGISDCICGGRGQSPSSVDDGLRLTMFTQGKGHHWVIVSDCVVGPRCQRIAYAENRHIP